MKCKCPYQPQCNSGKHGNYTISLYDSIGNVIRPLRFFHGMCKKADEIATILQVKYPHETVAYDHS